MLANGNAPLPIGPGDVWTTLIRTWVVPAGILIVSVCALAKSDSGTLKT